MCESFRNLPKFQINSLFEDSTFTNWTGDYRIFFKENYHSERFHTCRADLFVSNNCTIRYALLCSWGKSIVYITRNSNINMGFVLFIRNENTGLDILGVTARFVPMSVNTTNSRVSVMLNELFQSRENRNKIRFGN